MLELLLLRHAKSRWDEEGADDHDRDLAPRGEKAAGRVGKLLRAESIVPDRVVCSTAKRARRTCELVLANIEGEVPTVHDGSLYLASPSRLLDVARRQPAEVRRVMLIGHNPGLESFAARLVRPDGEAPSERLGEKFPTGALAQIAFETDRWKDIAFGAGRLVRFTVPRELD